MRLKGKVALIAGAGRNNGKAIALTYAREGADLILIAQKRSDELNQVAKECEAFGVKALPLLADVSKADEVNRVVQLGLKRFSQVDVLVHVVGLRQHKPLWEYSDDEWRHGFDVNLHSAFYLAKALIPGMIQRKSGCIISLGGMASLKSDPTRALVIASKHGLYGLIKSLAMDLGRYGIRANLLSPSYIANERLNPEWYPELGGNPNANVEQTIPMRRVGTRQELANVALFLASDESSYITGDCISCAGGRQM